MANKVTSIRVDNKLDLLFEASMIPKNQIVQCAIDVLYRNVVDNNGNVDISKLVGIVRMMSSGSSSQAE